MAILQFAFGNDPQAPDFRPHNYPRNLVVYTGTHDNDTTVGWWTGGRRAQHTDPTREHRERARARPPLSGASTDRERCTGTFIRAVLASVADTAIVPAQDLLGLGQRGAHESARHGQRQLALAARAGAADAGGHATPRRARRDLRTSVEARLRQGSGEAGCLRPLRRFFLSRLDDATHEPDADDHQGTGDDPDLTDTHP